MPTTIVPNQTFRHGTETFEAGESYEVADELAYYFKMVGWVGGEPQPTGENTTLEVHDGEHGHESEVKDGSALEVFPIDAKEAVASGEYTYDPPATAEAATQEVAADLDSLKKDELVDLAESKGIDTKGMTKAEIVEALKSE